MRCLLIALMMVMCAGTARGTDAYSVEALGNETLLRAGTQFGAGITWIDFKIKSCAAVRKAPTCPFATLTVGACQPDGTRLVHAENGLIPNDGYFIVYHDVLIVSQPCPVLVVEACTNNDPCDGFHYTAYPCVTIQPQVLASVAPVTFPAGGDGEVIVSFDNRMPAGSGFTDIIGFNFGLHWRPPLRYVPGSGHAVCPGACAPPWILANPAYNDSIVSIICYILGAGALQDGAAISLKLHNDGATAVNACNRGIWFRDLQTGCALGDLTTEMAPIPCTATDVFEYPRSTWGHIKNLYR